MFVRFGKNQLPAFEEEIFRLIPELRKLSEQDLSAIILLVHPKGPFSNYPEQDRPAAVGSLIFNDQRWKGWDKPEIRKAIDVLRLCLYDELEVEKAILQRKLSDINKYLGEIDISSAAGRKELSGLVSSKEAIRKQMNSLDEEIKIKDSDLKLKGRRKISWLEEQLRKNMFPTHKYFPDDLPKETAP